MHVESSGLKAAATWHRIEILQNCRECCGGMGFLSANKIGPMLADMNVDATFEGDNTVMMQQVSPSTVVLSSQQCCGMRTVTLEHMSGSDADLRTVLHVSSQPRYSMPAPLAEPF